MSISVNRVTGLMPNLVKDMRPVTVVGEAGRQQLPGSGNNSPRNAAAVASPGKDSLSAADFDAYFNGLPRNLQFEVDDQSGVSIITVSDRETGEIIRQFPAEEVVASARYIAEQIPARKVGTLLNTEG